MFLAASSKMSSRRKADRYVRTKTALQALCNTRRWQQGLNWECVAKGGLGNIRNEMLNCIRFALEAGGSSFLML